MHECTLQRNAGCACDVIARILQDIVQIGVQDSGALRQDDAKLGEQSSNTVYACCAFLFEPFTQPMHTCYALLLWSLNGYKAHLRMADCLTLGATKMNCFKRLGEKAMAGTLERQVVELNIRASILKRLTELGMLQTATVAYLVWLLCTSRTSLWASSP